MDLQSHTLTSSCGRFSRRVWHLPSARAARRIGIFLDGEHYLEHMDAPAVMTHLTDIGRIPGTACLFISNDSAGSRHHDYICNQPYKQFIVEDVLPWMLKRHPTAGKKDHLIAGTSLSGLQAAYTALSHLSIFRRALCQSGSFWWNNEWLASRIHGSDGPRGRFWLSAGTKEKGAGMSHPPTGLFQPVDQDAAIDHFQRELERHGHHVYHHVYEGGHESANWKDELPDAMQWLLGDLT